MCMQCARLGPKPTAGAALFARTPQETPLHLRCDANLYVNGRGNKTPIHYDREGNTNLHFCMCGRKRIVYFGNDQRHALGSLAVIRSSCRAEPERFNDPDYMEERPELKRAIGHRFDLNPGEMFLMPPRSWHYMEYEEPNVSLTLAFYRSETGLLEGLLGPENWSWQLYTNESNHFAHGHHRTLTCLLFRPARLVCCPYLAIYPKVCAFLFHHRCRRALDLLEKCNLGVVDHVIVPIGITAVLFPIGHFFVFFQDAGILSTPFSKRLVLSSCITTVLVLAAASFAVSCITTTSLLGTVYAFLVVVGEWQRW